jgi:hypothetical protein
MVDAYRSKVAGTRKKRAVSKKSVSENVFFWI